MRRNHHADPRLTSLLEALTVVDDPAEPVDLEHLFAAAEGRLQEGDAELLREQIHRQPAVGAVVSDLAALHAALQEPRRPEQEQRFGRRRLGPRVGWLAATLVIFVLSVLPRVLPEESDPVPAQERAAVEAGRSSDEPELLLKAGFEVGDLGGWSAVKDAPPSS